MDDRAERKEDDKCALLYREDLGGRCNRRRDDPIHDVWDLLMHLHDFVEETEPRNGEQSQ